jgi:hypothetical protein
MASRWAPIYHGRLAAIRNILPMNNRLYRGLDAMHAAMLSVVRATLILGLVLCAPAGFAQTTTSGTVTGVVVDATGNPIPGAQITSGSGDLLATTDSDGRFTLSSGAGRVAVEATHYAPVSVTIAGQAPLRIRLEQPFESVTVSAYRSPLSGLDSPASTRVLTAQTLRHAASLPLDDKLRTVPGFELFRRSSSLPIPPVRVCPCAVLDPPQPVARWWSSMKSR